MLRLKELRTLRGLTQQELGKRIGASKSSMSMYENGLHDPDLDTCKKIADVLGVSLDVLMGRSSDVPKDDDVWWLREKMRNDPDYRILFDAASTAKPEHLKAAAAVLQSLKGEKPDD